MKTFFILVFQQPIVPLIPVFRIKRIFEIETHSLKLQINPVLFELNSDLRVHQNYSRDTLRFRPEFQLNLVVSTLYDLFYLILGEPNFGLSFGANFKNTSNAPTPFVAADKPERFTSYETPSVNPPAL
jgi:hypothetical protein